MKPKDYKGKNKVLTMLEVDGKVTMFDCTMPELRRNVEKMYMPKVGAGIADDTIVAPPEVKKALNELAFSYPSELPPIKENDMKSTWTQTQVDNLLNERDKLAGNLTLAECKLALVRAERDMLAAELRLVKLQLKEAKGE